MTRADALFPAPPAENSWMGDPWWNLQLSAHTLALQIERMVPVARARERALLELRQAITTAQALLPQPTEAARVMRLGQSLAPYVPMPMDSVHRVLRFAKLGRDDLVYDLGCGDGRVVLEAAHVFGCRAIGIEAHPDLYRQAIARWRQLPRVVQDRVVILDGDLARMWDRIQQDATVVIVYWVSETMRRWLPAFQQLRPGTRILSYSFDFGDHWPANEVLTGPPEEPYRISKWTV